MNVVLPFCLSHLHPYPAKLAFQRWIAGCTGGAEVLNLSTIGSGGGGGAGAEVFGGGGATDGSSVSSSPHEGRKSEGSSTIIIDTKSQVPFLIFTSILIIFTYNGFGSSN